MADSSVDKQLERDAEAQLIKKYGMLPSKRSILDKRMKGGDKKYFDSADWAKERQTTAHSEPRNEAYGTPPHSLETTSLPPPPKITKPSS